MQRAKTFLIIILTAMLLTSCASTNTEQNSDNTASISTSAVIESTNTSTDKAVENTTTAASDNPTTTEANTDTQQANTPVKLDGVLKAHFLDVGQADCIYIELPNNEKMLIDAGNNGDRDTILNYLNSQGVNKLDYVIGTHPHEDHIGSLDAVINYYNIGSIYMPKASSNTKTFEDVLTAIQAKDLKVKAPESGSYIINLRNQIDKNTVKDELVVQVLAPNSNSYEDLNNYSIVVKITFRNTSMLFMGDAEDLSESEIISAGYDVRANLLKVGHHGSAYSTTENFIKDVQPKYAIISVGKGNSYEHPAQSTIDRLNNAGILIYRTDEVGTIIATSDGETITIDKKASPTKEQAPPAQEKDSSTVGEQSTSDKTQDTIVYVTKTGEKYHLDGCRSLSKSKISIKLSDAKSKGYTPCSICNPPK